MEGSGKGSGLFPTHRASDRDGSRSRSHNTDPWGQALTGHLGRQNEPPSGTQALQAGRSRSRRLHVWDLWPTAPRVRGRFSACMTRTVVTLLAAGEASRDSRSFDVPLGLCPVAGSGPAGDGPPGNSSSAPGGAASLPSQPTRAFPRPSLSPVPHPLGGLGAFSFNSLPPALEFKIVFATLAVCLGGRSSPQRLWFDHTHRQGQGRTARVVDACGLQLADAPRVHRRQSRQKAGAHSTSVGETEASRLGGTPALVCVPRAGSLLEARAGPQARPAAGSALHLSEDSQEGVCAAPRVSAAVCLRTPPLKGFVRNWGRNGRWEGALRGQGPASGGSVPLRCL